MKLLERLNELPESLKLQLCKASKTYQPHFKKIPSAAVTGGFLLQHESGRCIHPFEGAEDPRPNTDVILHSDCNRDRKALTWIQDPQLSMKHNSPWCYCNSLDRGPEVLSILDSFSLIQIRQLYILFWELSDFCCRKTRILLRSDIRAELRTLLHLNLGWELREVMKADSLGQETRSFQWMLRCFRSVSSLTPTPSVAKLALFEIIQSTMSCACSCSEKVGL